MSSCPSRNGDMRPTACQRLGSVGETADLQLDNVGSDIDVWAVAHECHDVAPTMAAARIAIRRRVARLESMGLPLAHTHGFIQAADARSECRGWHRGCSDRKISQSACGNTPTSIAAKRATGAMIEVDLQPTQLCATPGTLACARAP